jgi:hypothetical protein
VWRWWRDCHQRPVLAAQWQVMSMSFIFVPVHLVTIVNDFVREVWNIWSIFAQLQNIESRWRFGLASDAGGRLYCYTQH